MARGRLAELHERHGAEATARADKYSRAYEYQRGAMVVDVIASRQRRYESRVRDGIVPQYRSRASAMDLATLAGTAPAWLPLRGGEAQTMREVAAGLLRWGAAHGCGDDEEAVLAWADAVEDVRFAPRLDPYVGQVSGVGPALFAYLRMRSGADALKPDVRVHDALEALGWAVPRNAAALLTACEALAHDVGMSRLTLDQLLWWSRPGTSKTRADAASDG